MTTTTTTDILNSIKKDFWKNTDKSLRTAPIQWINDETPLNDTNLNTLTRCIDELQSLAAENGEDAKKAFEKLVGYLDKNIISQINFVIENEGDLQKVIGISETVTALESTVNSINSIVESNITPMGSDIESIKSEIGTIKNDINSIKTNIQSIQENIVSLQTADEEIQAEIAKINANIEALNNMIIVGTDDPNSPTDPELIESLKDAKYYIRYEEENEV